MATNTNPKPEQPVQEHSAMYQLIGVLCKNSMTTILQRWQKHTPLLNLQRA